MEIGTDLVAADIHAGLDLQHISCGKGRPSLNELPYIAGGAPADSGKRGLAAGPFDEVRNQEPVEIRFCRCRVHECSAYSSLSGESTQSIIGTYQPGARTPGMSVVNVDRLKSAMNAAGLDQSALAARVGCTPGAINQILTGRTLRSRLLPEIANHLGVSAAWLQNLSDDPKDDTGPRLSIEEWKLLAAFRKLPEEDQAALSRVAESMLH